MQDGVVQDSSGINKSVEKSKETMIDNLENHDAIKNKYFSFYLPDNEGYITFGEIPSHIVPEPS
jgi:hypothetical protein